MTHLACLTPPGTGAIATLGLRGPRAWEIVRSLFRPRSASGRSLPDIPEAGRVWFGQFGGEVADEVVLSVKRTQPLPWIEIHGHGGREVVRWLLATLVSQGAVLCSWREFQRGTVSDPLQNLAAEALAEAPTVRTAAILLDQYHGAFGTAVRAALQALRQQDVPQAGALLNELARHAALGRHLTEPWRVVLAGAPNVGKSSLLNALAGFQRSIVSPTPGTTRDVVTARLAVDGWPIEFADTAGVRDTVGDLEGQGISRARDAAATADLTLWVVEAALPPVWPDAQEGHFLRVINKSDLPSSWDLKGAPEAILVSARAGEGLAGLCDRLSRLLIPDPPPSSAGVPFTARLSRRVEDASAILAAGDIDRSVCLLEGILARPGERT